MTGEEKKYVNTYKKARLRSNHPWTSRDGRAWFIAEVKASDTHLSAGLGHYQLATGARHAFQIVFDEPFVKADCFARTDPVVVPARTFLSQLV